MPPPWIELVGGRVLVDLPRHDYTNVEALVVEVSPSKKRVRMHLSYQQHPVWFSVSDVVFVEMLPAVPGLGMIAHCWGQMVHLTERYPLLVGRTPEGRPQTRVIFGSETITTDGDTLEDALKDMLHELSRRHRASKGQ